MGTENPIDIATLTFNLPIWISSPAKVKKLGVVERIVASVFNANGDASNAILNNDLLLGTRQVITPYGYQTLLIGNKLQALRAPQVLDEPNSSLTPADSPNSNLLWHAIVDLYGTLRPGISLVKLEQEDGSEVVGTISYDPTDDRFLLISVDQDTIPQNTLLPVNSVIDPLRSGPGVGLPVAAVGQRYLFTEATGSYEGEIPESWAGTEGQPLVANANDIVEYDGTCWQVSFESDSSPNNIQYVTNITTEIQYKWVSNAWIKSYQGLYTGGRWSLVL
jgi:hypothetical protein